ncbi:unnamed protein product [Fusarium graminearum]|uniref:Uncharacterized protein n=1 Tax=Gibberella zeae TaxID=5518 RepID=A0A4E9DTK8_GIBZA|nr:unnamed protein product [Fusarium graminearum]CAG2009729.1 unnamed protein product [Fusarium graminearum]
MDRYVDLQTPYASSSLPQIGCRCVGCSFTGPRMSRTTQDLPPPYSDVVGFDHCRNSKSVSRPWKKNKFRATIARIFRRDKIL